MTTLFASVDHEAVHALLEGAGVAAIYWVGRWSMAALRKPKLAERGAAIPPQQPAQTALPPSAPS